MKRIRIIVAVMGWLGLWQAMAQDTILEGVGDAGATVLRGGAEVIEQATGVFRSEPVAGDPVQLNGAPNAKGRHAFERGLYVGVGAGISNVKPKDSTRSEDGIAFGFTTEDDDLASKWYFGYWINPHVGFEMGGVGLGNVSVPFNFSDPRNGRSGTGEAEVEINGTVGSILLAVEPVSGVQVFLRGGANSWSRKLTSRFDVVGEDSVQRTQDRSGTGLVYGGGLAVNFQAGWHLRAEAEFYDVDGDEVSVFSAGLMYDFGPPWDW
ncbi:MAG: hypothetical protein ACI9TH_001851 [Kiritimatiellia bacterium]|jgi:hypothetical protein